MRPRSLRRTHLLNSLWQEAIPWIVGFSLVLFILHAF